MAHRVTWKEIAEFCEKLYGVEAMYGTDEDEDDVYFRCCECDEPIYEEDFQNDEALCHGYCPICGANLMGIFGNGDDNWFEEEENENEDEDD